MGKATAPELSTLQVFSARGSSAHMEVLCFIHHLWGQYGKLSRETGREVMMLFCTVVKN